MPGGARYVGAILTACMVVGVALRGIECAAATTSAGPDCACLRNGGEPGRSVCLCDVEGCYARCVEELCPSFPQCMLECSFRCYCAANTALGCSDHVDPGATPTAAPICPGDCNGDGRVTVEELVRSVNAVLGGQPTSTCPSVDWNRDDDVTVPELIKAVNTALYGCVRSSG